MRRASLFWFFQRRSGAPSLRLFLAVLSSRRRRGRQGRVARVRRERLQARRSEPLASHRYQLRQSAPLCIARQSASRGRTSFDARLRVKSAARSTGDLETRSDTAIPRNESQEMSPDCPIVFARTFAANHARPCNWIPATSRTEELSALRFRLRTVDAVLILRWFKSHPTPDTLSLLRHASSRVQASSVRKTQARRIRGRQLADRQTSVYYSRRRYPSGSCRCPTTCA